jgi:hypothetical protein
VLSLFGMINWIHTCHNPRVDADAGVLSGQMSGIFLNGLLDAGNKTKGSSRWTP